MKILLSLQKLFNVRHPQIYLSKCDILTNIYFSIVILTKVFVYFRTIVS